MFWAHDHPEQHPCHLDARNQRNRQVIDRPFSCEDTVEESGCEVMPSAEHLRFKSPSGPSVPSVLGMHRRA